MRTCSRRSSRSAATMVECAIVFPVTFLIMILLVFGGLGIFRYQELAHLSRLGARYASTHGGMYTDAKMPAQTGVPAVTSAADLKNFYLKGPNLDGGSQLVLLDPAKLTVEISWSEASRIDPDNFPFYADPSDITGQKIIRNTVNVKLSYDWVPGIWWSAITLRSSCTMPMSY